MNRSEYKKYLEETFPFPVTSEKLSELEQLIKFPILEKVSVPKSKLIEKIEEGLYQCAELNRIFIGLLHENHFDYDQEGNYFVTEYNGVSAWPAESVLQYANHTINGPDYIGEGIDYVIEKNKELLDIHGSLQNARDFDSKATNYLKNYLFRIYLNILYSFDDLKKKKEALEKGNQGEEYVAQELDLFKDKYKFAENVVLPYADLKGKTSETDLYVMTPKGILVCEIKNKGNERCIFKISKDGQWSKYNAAGKFLEVMDSPFSQNTRHCIATEKFLKDNGIADFKIIPVVIIANEEVRIENDSDNIVIRASELYNLVERLNFPEKYGEEYQNEVLHLFESKGIQKENFFSVYAVREGAEEAIRNATLKVLDVYKNYIMFEYQVGHDGRLRNEKVHKKRLKRWAVIFGAFLLYDIYAVVRIFGRHFSWFYLLIFAISLCIWPFLSEEFSNDGK